MRSFWSRVTHYKRKWNIETKQRALPASSWSASTGSFPDRRPGCIHACEAHRCARCDRRTDRRVACDFRGAGSTARGVAGGRRRKSSSTRSTRRGHKRAGRARSCCKGQLWPPWLLQWCASKLRRAVLRIPREHGQLSDGNRALAVEVRRRTNASTARRCACRPQAARRRTCWSCKAAGCSDGSCRRPRKASRERLLRRKRGGMWRVCFGCPVRTS